MLSILHDLSLRKLCVVLVASLILSSASQVLSPAALKERQVTGPDASRDGGNETECSPSYSWLSAKERRAYTPLVERITAPTGFRRVCVAGGSFADWLRHLPVCPPGTPVTTARRKVVLAGDDPNLAAVIVLQPHVRRLLSGANMMLRLRAEYAWSVGDAGGLAFHYTCGHLASWRAWSAGMRPQIVGRSVRFIQTDIRDASRSSFCGYLETLFRFASSGSLLDDTRPVRDRTIAAGDFFLRTARPAHAVMVLDVATNPAGQVRVLLGAGGRPVQTFHMLREGTGSAWFAVTPGREIRLGREVRFGLDRLRRWSR